MEAPPPVEQPPPRDCLICFVPIRRNIPFWKQATRVACECRPNLHRACWDAWAAQAGPICVICRSQKYPPAPPYQHHVRPHLHDGLLLFGYPIDRTTAMFVIAVIFYIVLGFMGHLQPAGRPTYRPPYNRHTEL